jgi:TatD DNase family protein
VTALTGGNGAEPGHDGLRFFDSHCHLGYGDILGAQDDADAGFGGAIDWENVDRLVERARRAGVAAMVSVGTDRRHSRAQIAVAQRYDDVWATVGLHPHDAIDGVASIADLVDEARVVAVGECGLDYHYDHSPRDVQRAAFAEQIALAHRVGLPLVIHTREAWADTFDILRAEGVPEHTIFHCFTGGPDEAAGCLALGAYLSYSGIVTFKTATDLRESARRCPPDRFLIETDSPYLAPVPHRGKPNEPAFVPLVAACLAEVMHLDVAAVAYHSFANATVAFELGGS